MSSEEKKMTVEATDNLMQQRKRRAFAMAEAGGFEAALAAGTLPKRADITVSEGIVLGLFRQGVRAYLSVFGHGSTDVAEVLRVYEAAGLLRCHGNALHLCFTEREFSSLLFPRRSRGSLWTGRTQSGS